MSRIQKKKLKIIHLLFSKGFAGTERSTAESCNAQCVDHDVILVCSNKPERSSGASILQHLDSRVKVLQISPRFFLKRNLQNILDSEQPDIVHAHLRRSTRVLAKCKTEAAKVSTLHIGINSDSFLNMDGLIAISPWQMKTIPDAYRGQVQWIRNSLSPYPKLSAKQISELKNDLGLDARTFIVGGVGRLSYSKGWDTLIKAFLQLKVGLADVPITLLLIGEGRDEEKLKQLAAGSKDIMFLGYKNNIKDYYSIFDVFVCPSREEPMGRVILEALDAGTPVIASSIEGPADILSEYPGTLVPVDDVIALRSALESALADKHLQKARPDLSAHYINNVSVSILSFYVELVEKKVIHGSQRQK